MRKAAIEQVRLEEFAKGYERAQNDAAIRFGQLAYEQANKAMIIETARLQRDVVDHIREHGKWVA